MFLITGCGRSGTMYMAKMLQSAGLDVGHEALGQDGVVSSIWAVADDWYPSYHQQRKRPAFDVVLHQVREPLATIGSLTTAQPGSWRWNARHIPIRLGEDSVLQMAAKWNPDDKEIQAELAKVSGKSQGKLGEILSKLFRKS